MDSATYRQLMGQIKKSCPIPHYKFPSHNLVSLETLVKISSDLSNEAEGGSKFLDHFPCYRQFEYCVELSSPLYYGCGLVDYAVDLVKKKAAWEKKLKTMKVPNIEKAINCITHLRDNKPTKVSGNLAEYIAHFHDDPEPGFSGNYNWLYTGGNLCAVEEQDGATLIAANYFGQKPGFNILRLNKSLDEVQYKTSCQLKAYLPVLQISCQGKENDVVVCVRQKNYLSLFSVNKEDYLSAPKKHWRKKVLNSKLLTSVDLKGDCKEVVITDSKYDVHVFDVETKIKVFAHSGRKKTSSNAETDAWGQALFGEHGVYLAFRNSLSVLDVRDANVTKLLYKPISATNYCEDICSLEKCPSDPNYIYLGTTHSFLQVDVRNGKAVQRWTHLMKNPPQFVAPLQDCTRDFVVLQSHHVEETVGITNECLRNEDGVTFLSRSLPCLLDGIKSSLKLARFHGICLSPLVAKRFDFSVTGVGCLRDKEGYIHLFTENGGGDIFSRKIREKSASHLATDAEEKVLDSMRAYESHFEDCLPQSLPGNSLEYINMKPIVEKLREPSGKPKGNERSEVSWKYHEMFAPESLCHYKDVLAQKVLEVWGYGAEEPDLLTETISSDTKVREWMDKL